MHAHTGDVAVFAEVHFARVESRTNFQLLAHHRAGPTWHRSRAPRQGVFVDELPLASAGMVRKFMLREHLATEGAHG
jgi:hypothetical protein